MSVKMPRFPVIVKAYSISFSVDPDITGCGGEGEIPLRDERHGHPGRRDLAVLFKIKEGDTVHCHIAVICHGEGQGKPGCTDAVIIPFLQPERGSLDKGTVILTDLGKCVSLFDQVSVSVEERAGYSDAVLHNDASRILMIWLYLELLYLRSRGRARGRIN